jgi:hypothetical protein
MPINDEGNVSMNTAKMVAKMVTKMASVAPRFQNGCQDGDRSSSFSAQDGFQAVVLNLT